MFKFRNEEKRREKAFDSALAESALEFQRAEAAERRGNMREALAHLNRAIVLENIADTV